MSGAPTTALANGLSNRRVRDLIRCAARRHALHSPTIALERCGASRARPSNAVTSITGAKSNGSGSPGLQRRALSTHFIIPPRLFPNRKRCSHIAICSSRIVAPRPFDRSTPAPQKGQLRASKKCFEPDWDDRFQRLGVKVDDHRCPKWGTITSTFRRTSSLIAPAIPSALARDLRLFHDLASPIHNANAREFQRDVDPKRRRFRHNVPRLSSISRCLGQLNVVTPFHHLSGTATCTALSVQGPLRHLAQWLSPVPQAHFGIAVLAGLRRQAAIAKCKAWIDPIHTKSVRGKWLAKPASIPTAESSGQASGRCRSGARSVTPRAKSTWRGRLLTP